VSLGIWLIGVYAPISQIPETSLRQKFVAEEWFTTSSRDCKPKAVNCEVWVQGVLMLSLLLSSSLRQWIIFFKRPPLIVAISSHATHLNTQSIWKDWELKCKWTMVQTSVGTWSKSVSLIWPRIQIAISRQDYVVCEEFNGSGVSSA